MEIKQDITRKSLQHDHPYMQRRQTRRSFPEIYDHFNEHFSCVLVHTIAYHVEGPTENRPGELVTLVKYYHYRYYKAYDPFDTKEPKNPTFKI